MKQSTLALLITLCSFSAGAQTNLPDPLLDSMPHFASGSKSLESDSKGRIILMDSAEIERIVYSGAYIDMLKEDIEELQVDSKRHMDALNDAISIVDQYLLAIDRISHPEKYIKHKKQIIK